MPYLCRMQKASVRNEELKEQWETLVSVLTERFSETESIDIEGDFVFGRSSGIRTSTQAF